MKPEPFPLIRMFLSAVTIAVIAISLGGELAVHAADREVFRAGSIAPIENVSYTQSLDNQVRFRWRLDVLVQRVRNRFVFA